MTLATHKLTLQTPGRLLYTDLNLAFQPGEVWGILGANGCGKTTLLHTLAGLIQPTSGAIQLDAMPIATFSPKARARRIGLLLQEATLPPLQTVFDYVHDARYPHSRRFSNSEHQHIVTETLAALELTAFANQRLSQLSGGEQRRIAIASLLAQTPAIYLLDEPTNHLDLRHQVHLFRLLSQLAHAEKTIIMSLHDVQQAQHFCTHVLLLQPDGRYLQGKTRDLLTADHLTVLYQHNIVNVGSEGALAG